MMVASGWVSSRHVVPHEREESEWAVVDTATSCLLGPPSQTDLLNMNRTCAHSDQWTSNLIEK